MCVVAKSLQQFSVLQPGCLCLSNGRKCMALPEPEVRLACCSLDSGGDDHAGGGLQVPEDVFASNPE